MVPLYVSLAGCPFNPLWIDTTHDKTCQVCLDHKDSECCELSRFMPSHDQCLQAELKQLLVDVVTLGAKLQTSHNAPRPIIAEVPMVRVMLGVL